MNIGKQFAFPSANMIGLYGNIRAILMMVIIRNKSDAIPYLGPYRQVIISSAKMKQNIEMG